MANNTAVLRAAKFCGSQAALARALKVAPVTVNQWVTRKRPVPPERCVSIEQITGGKVTRRHLRDDWEAIWPELAVKAKAG
jgi:DNA-binding transcriptional regulator YdaS (Cro superfamily)